MEFNDLIHGERGRLIGTLPKGSRRVVSVGCAGAWYFDWFSDNYGLVDEHIGVELYSPEPPELPSNVRWLAASAGNFPEVESASVDLVFSGQNIEHLFGNDFIGFLRESNRVLKDEGWLVVDSPNRLITTEHRWIQPQHTLELSARQAKSLLKGSGFEVMETRGIWSCRDLDVRLPVTSVPDDSSQVRERLDSADIDPDGSFIWWIVARKVGEPASELAHQVDSMLAGDFPSFVRTRYAHQIGRLNSITGSEAVLEVRPDEAGFALYGPYVPLTPGRYEVSFRYKLTQAGGRLHFDVTSSAGTVIHSEQRVSTQRSVGRWVGVTLEFDVKEFTEGVETRVFASGSSLLLQHGSALVPS
jgi:SAM-dependent methyltransferase